jgi:hypothetical protein
LTADDCRSVAHKERLEEELGEPFPQDPHKQLWGAIGAVSDVDEPARSSPPPARHPGKLGHRCQRAGHGVRQHGRDLGDRRRVHPRPSPARSGSTASS